MVGRPLGMNQGCTSPVAFPSHPDQVSLGVLELRTLRKVSRVQVLIPTEALELWLSFEFWGRPITTKGGHLHVTPLSGCWCSAVNDVPQGRGKEYGDSMSGLLSRAHMPKEKGGVFSIVTSRRQGAVRASRPRGSGSLKWGNLVWSWDCLNHSKSLGLEQGRQAISHFKLWAPSILVGPVTSHDSSLNETSNS